MSIKKHMTQALTVAAVGASMIGLAACGGGDAEKTTAAATEGASAPATDEMVTVGFVAVGPEGAWRAANEANVQGTFTKEAGFDLKYAPATNLDQKSQIDAFTAFVDEGVDVILLSATEGSGWEDSLKRAQEAKIPVILIDRGIEPNDTSLYVTRIAPDNIEVAKGVANWAVSAFPEGAKYFVLEGPAGVGVVNERNEGWDSVMKDHPEFVKLGAQTANWSADEGKSVTETVLKANNNDVPLIFAHNDEMGLGAAKAVAEAGLTPGVDVKIATIDGTKGAMEQLLAGNLSFVAEYNPLFGPTAVDVVNTVLSGGTVDPYIIVPSGVFDKITQEELDARQY